MEREIVTLDLFIETQDRPETPAALTWKERKNATTQAAKVISWKFKDPCQEFPEIRQAAGKKITSPKDLFDAYRFLFSHETVEYFIVFWLNSANKVIGYDVVSKGNLNSSIVHPREVFRGAVVASCANIILAHNHPSGNTEPSNEDIAITKRIVEAGKLLDIHVFDHIIMTDTQYYSMTEARII